MSDTPPNLAWLLGAGEINDYVPRRYHYVSLPVESEDGEIYDSLLVIQERHTLSDVTHGNVVPIAECSREKDAALIVRLLNLCLN